MENNNKITDEEILNIKNFIESKNKVKLNEHQVEFLVHILKGYYIMGSRVNGKLMIYNGCLEYLESRGDK